jgi:hypothetical protein
MGNEQEQNVFHATVSDMANAFITGRFSPRKG